MFLHTINNNMDVFIATMAAIAAFSSFLVVSWPYLVRDTLGARMRELADEREVIRIRERGRLQERNQSLRTEPKKIFKQIFDRFNLANQLTDTTIVRNLRMAGYCAQGPGSTVTSSPGNMPALLFN